MVALIDWPGSKAIKLAVHAGITSTNSTDATFLGHTENRLPSTAAWCSDVAMHAYLLENDQVICQAHSNGSQPQFFTQRRTDGTSYAQYQVDLAPLSLICIIQTIKP